MKTTTRQSIGERVAAHLINLGVELNMSRKEFVERINFVAGRANK